MTYEVMLFAALKDQTRLNTWCCQSEEPLSASGLLARFFETFPDLAGLRKVTRLAVNQSFCSEDQALDEGDDLALIPPVSGG